MPGGSRHNGGGAWKGIVSDERVVLTNRNTSLKYVKEFRRVKAAVKWQIWAALIIHLIMRYLKSESRWSGNYSRFVGIVSTAIWMKKYLGKLLQFYGTAPPLDSTDCSRNVPYLPGFEKAY